MLVVDMTTGYALLLLLLLLFLLSGLSESAASCPNTTSSSTTKPLYLLSLVSIPSGYYVLPGHRIAQDEINNRSDLLPGYHIELIVDTIEKCSSNEAGIGLRVCLRRLLSPIPASLEEHFSMVSTISSIW